MPSLSKQVLSRPPLGAVAAPTATPARTTLPEQPQVVNRPVQPKLTEERLLEMERKGYEDGFASGERAGFELGNENAARMIAAIEQLQQQIAALRQQLVADAEREVVNLSLAVANRVLGYEVEQDHPVVLAGIAAAREHFAPSAKLTIRLHPNDRAVLEAHQPELLALLGEDFELHGDGAIAPGGVVMEGDGKLIDATLVTRFEQVVNALLGSVSS